MIFTLQFTRKCHNGCFINKKINCEANISKKEILEILNELIKQLKPARQYKFDKVLFN